MRRSLLSVVAIVALAVTAVPAAAQNSDDQAVRQVVQRLFDGMRSRDTTMIRSTFAEQAMFFNIGRDGSVSTLSPSGFITSISRAPEHLVLDEVLHDVEVRIDGPLASVWTYYDLFVGDDFVHCGYDAFQLLNVGGEWKIVAVADTRRTEGCRRLRTGS